MSKGKNVNVELFEALDMIEQEKGISVSYLIEKIVAAIVIAVKRDHGGKENIFVIMDPETSEFSVSLRKIVVDEVEDADEEMTLEEAQNYKTTALVGDNIDIRLETKQFGRIAAQTAKHVIRQGIREAERGQQLEEFQSKHQELVTAVVTRIDTKSGAVTVRLDKTETLLPVAEQIGNENFKEGEHIKVFIVDVRDSDRGPKVLISRTHPGLVKRLFEIEVPEIFEGIVEIKAVSREAGSRTKLAVISHEEDVDAVGACIGARGARVEAIVEELGGEKIDIVEYSENPAEFVAAALAPASVVDVVIEDEKAKSCFVHVPDDQLSLAIGNKGQNVRLAAKLTGWKIDIRPESGYFTSGDDSKKE